MKHEVEYTADRMLIHTPEGTMSVHRTGNEERDNETLAAYIADLERYSFYKSDGFTNDFNRHLETAILATRGGGSGAVACRDTLLSLYNGSAYKANLSKWYSLDSENRAALLFVLEHQTASNRQAIDQYLPQYKADFDRMRNEVTEND